MADSSRKVAEYVLINLAFAKAEIELPFADPRSLSRAIEHIDEAVALLRRLAPDFDASVNAEGPAARTVA